MAASTSAPSGSPEAFSTTTWRSRPPRRTSSTTSGSSTRRCHSMTSRGWTPSRERISSPSTRPARAAGDPGATAITRGRLTGDRVPAELPGPASVLGVGSAPMELTIESIRDGDRERHHALMRQAFGGTDTFDPDAPPADPERFVCAYLGDRLVGSVLTFDFAMTWGGRGVPCGGVSGWVVSPEDLGRAAARPRLAQRTAERR